MQLFALPTPTSPIKLQAVSAESQPLNKSDYFLFLSRDVNTIGVAWQGSNQTNIQQVCKYIYIQVMTTLALVYENEL